MRHLERQRVKEATTATAHLIRSFTETAHIIHSDVADAQISRDSRQLDSPDRKSAWRLEMTAMGQDKKAKQAINKRMQANQQFDEARKLLSTHQWYLAKGKLYEANKLYGRAVAKLHSRNPTDAVARSQYHRYRAKLLADRAAVRMELSRFRMELSRYREARDDCLDALGCDDQLLSAYTSGVRCLVKLGDWSAASQLVERCRRAFAPRPVSILTSMSAHVSNLKRIIQTIGDLLKPVSDKRNSEYQLTAKRCLAQHPSAMRHQLTPTDLKSIHQADVLIDRLRDTMPKCESLQCLRIRALIVRGKYEEAVAEATTKLHKGAASNEHKVLHAIALFRTKRVRESVNLLERVLRNDAEYQPARRILLFFKGMSQAEQKIRHVAAAALEVGDCQRIVHSYRRGVQLDPTNLNFCRTIFMNSCVRVLLDQRQYRTIMSEALLIKAYDVRAQALRNLARPMLERDMWETDILRLRDECRMQFDEMESLRVEKLREKSPRLYNRHVDPKLQPIRAVLHQTYDDEFCAKLTDASIDQTLYKQVHDSLQDFQQLHMEGPYKELDIGTEQEEKRGVPFDGLPFVWDFGGLPFLGPVSKIDGTHARDVSKFDKLLQEYKIDDRDPDYEIKDEMIDGTHANDERHDPRHAPVSPAATVPPAASASPEDIDHKRYTELSATCLLDMLVDQFGNNASAVTGPVHNRPRNRRDRCSLELYPNIAKKEIQ